MLTLEISKELKDEIWDYCRVNNITNINEFTIKMLKQGFTVEKFGATPQVIEKKVEVEVEKIVEKVIEKIVEVPVEKIIEKEVYVTDDSQLSDFTKKIEEQQTTIINNESEISKQKQKINTLETDITKLKEELEKEKKKNKKDIYGEY